MECTVSSMNDRISTLESNSAKVGPRGINNTNEFEYLFWALTPKHHALLQLELFSFTDAQIGNRFGTSEAAARSAISHLRTRLNVSRRDLLSTKYLELFLNSSDTKYFDNARIPKCWAKSFGLMSNEAAKNDDPFFKIVNARYRAPRTFRHL